VVAMTLTLVAVYVPIGFMTGTTGKLFTEFAWTLAGAVLVSGFVALTLSPMMCSKLLRRQEKHNFLYNVIERGLRGMTSGYRATLRGALGARPLVLLIGLAVAGSSWFVFSNLTRIRGPSWASASVPRAPPSSSWTTMRCAWRSCSRRSPRSSAISW
jgi:multidrug efflux pump